MIWNTGITRTNTNKLILIIGIMLSAMILPSLEIRESLPHVRVDDAFIFGAFAINLLFWVTRRSRSGYGLGYANPEVQRRAHMAVTIVFSLLIASMIISNLYAVFFLGGTFGLRDVMEFVTLAKYYLVITLTLSLEVQEGEFSLLRKTFLLGFGVMLLLTWSQFLNIFNVNAWLTPFFAQSHLNNLVNANPPRVLGSFDNPNVMGIVSVLMMTVFVTWYYFKRNDRLVAVMLVAASALAIKMTFMTISRTGFIATAAVLVFLSVWAIVKFQFRKEILLKIIILLLVTLAVVFTSPRGFTTRLGEATNPKTSTSIQGHFLRAGPAIKFIQESPVLGWGTAKNNMTTLVDDEYLLITRRYGFIGLAMYLWLFFRPVKAAWRRISSSSFYNTESGLREDKTLLAITFVAATVAVLVYNITAGIFYNLQLMTLFAIFMGLVYRIEEESN